MEGFLIVLLLGFPAVFVSLLISAVGIWKERFWLVILGAALFVPFSYYLFGMLSGFFPPLFQIGSAFAVRAKKKYLAWLLLLPALLLFLWTLGAGLFVRFP